MFELGLLLPPLPKSTVIGRSAVTSQSPLTGKPSSSPGVVTSWAVSSDFLTPGWMASYTLQSKCYQTPGLVHRGREFFFSLLLSGFEIVKLVCDVSVFSSEAPR